MKNKERVISYGIIVILLGIIVYFIFLPTPDYVDFYQDKIDKLELKVKSIEKVNDSLDLEIEGNILYISKLNDSIKGKDIEILNLNKETNEKVNNVDSFNNDKLQRFFSERYNTSNNPQ